MNFMPKIPALNNPTVNPQSLGGGQLRLNVTPELVGGAKVRNLAALSDTLGEAAVFMDVQRRRSDGQSVMKADKATTEYVESVMKTLAPLKGERSFGYTDALVKIVKPLFEPADTTTSESATVTTDPELMEKYGLDTASEKFQALQNALGGMRSYVRKEYEPILKQKFADLFQRAGVYEETQRKRALIQDYQHTRAALLKAIRDNPLDVDGREKHIVSLYRTMGQMKVAMEWSEERDQAETANIEEAVALSVVNGLLDRQQGEEAEQFFKENQNKFVKTDKAQLEARIKERVTLEKAQHNVVVLESLPEEEQQEELRHIDDPEELEMTRQLLVHRNLEEKRKQLKLNYDNSEKVFKFIWDSPTSPTLVDLHYHPDFNSLDEKTKQVMKAQLKERTQGDPEFQPPQFTGKAVLAVDDGRPFKTSLDVNLEEDSADGTAATLVSTQNDIASQGQVKESAKEENSHYVLKQESRTVGGWVDNILLSDRDPAKNFAYQFDVNHYEKGKFRSKLYEFIGGIQEDQRIVQNSEQGEVQQVGDINVVKTRLQNKLNLLRTLSQKVESVNFDPEFRNVVLTDVLQKVLSEGGSFEEVFDETRLNELIQKHWTVDNFKQWQKTVQSESSLEKKANFQNKLSGIAKANGLGRETRKNVFDRANAFLGIKFKNFKEKLGREPSEKEMSYYMNSLFHDKVFINGVSRRIVELTNKEILSSYVNVGDKKVFVKDLIALPESMRNAIGEKLKRENKELTMQNIAEVYEARLQQDRKAIMVWNGKGELVQNEHVADVIGKSVSKFFPLDALTPAGGVQQIIADGNKPPTVVHKALAHKKAPKVMRMDEESLEVFKEEMEGEEGKVRLGDYLMFTEGTVYNLTVLAENAYRMTGETLKDGKDEMLNSLPQGARAPVGNLIDGIIRDKQGRAPELFAQQGDWKVGAVSFNSEREIIQSFDQVTKTAPFEYEVADRQINRTLGALGQMLSGLNPKLVKSTGEKGLFQLTRPKVQTMVDAVNLLKVEGLNFNVDDVMKNPVEQIKLVEAYLFGRLWKKYNKTKNPLAFVIGEFLYGKSAIERAREQAKKIKKKGDHEKYEIVSKYLDGDKQKGINKFFLALKAQS